MLVEMKEDCVGLGMVGGIGWDGVEWNWFGWSGVLSVSMDGVVCIL